MLRDVEVVNRGPDYYGHPFGQAKELDWGFLRRLQDLLEEEGLIPMLLLTAEDVIGCVEGRLNHEQAYEVLDKMCRKWDIEWSDAVYEYAKTMFPEEMAREPEEE